MLRIPHQKFVLDNGLQVIVHEDHSNPLVTVCIVYHVGSAREEAGRTGFAHLFEHMLFQGSEHVPEGQHFALVQEAGGQLNGMTSSDRTVYYETLPSNHLELALWLESDRMGFLLPAMTQAKLDNQRDVVMNERRQNYDNRPYGRVHEELAKLVYPAGHPYSWLPIGSMEDIAAATLDDVEAFFRRWYGPNNATLVVGGDVESATASELVRKYFESIPAGPEARPQQAQPVRLTSERHAVLEDQVQLPQLSVAWPTVPRFADDDPALDLLMMILSQNDSSIFDKALSIDEQLASQVTASHSSNELGGQLTFHFRSAPGVSLERLHDRTLELLEQLGQDGVDRAQLTRMQNQHEASFVRQLETVFHRCWKLADYNTFLGDPDRCESELERLHAVTPEQVQRVLQDYVLDSGAAWLSTVPTGHPEAALPEPEPRRRDGATSTSPPATGAIDRSVRPAAGPRPAFRSPEIWRETCATPDGRSEWSLAGTRSGASPQSELMLCMPRGTRSDSLRSLGLASLTGALLNEGTRQRSTTQFREALDGIGAELRAYTNTDWCVVWLNCLDKHLAAAMNLFTELVLEPRLGEDDFERLRKQRLVTIDTRVDDPQRLASVHWDRVLYGAESIDGHPASGHRASVEALTLAQLVEFHGSLQTARDSVAMFVGAAAADEVRDLCAPILSQWRGTDGTPQPPASPAIDHGEQRIFLVHKPGAAQSQVRVGHLSVATTHPDYFPLTMLNYILGGAFTSRLNSNLREDKGYTYGARSHFQGGLRPGPFVAAAAVDTAATAASVHEIFVELEAIRDSVRGDELTLAKDAMIQSLATHLETVAAKRNWLAEIITYGFGDRVLEERAEMAESMTTERLLELARTHVRPEDALVLVVGDRDKVRTDLERLGRGEVCELGEL